MDSAMNLAAAKPYNIHHLQSEFHCFSPRDAYIALCERSRCKPILSVANLFPSVVGEWNSVTAIDLSRTYVGEKGACRIVELCQRLPNLTCLNLANNYLTNHTVWHLAKMALFHPALRHIELSWNEHISWTGAMLLAELGQRNVHITYLGLRHTGIKADLAQALFRQTRTNAVAMYAAAGRVPNPSNHPDAIHVRAMRRYFLENQEDGTVDVSCLVGGFHEHLQVLGRQHELAGYSDVFFEQLQARAPDERVSWEVFLVLVLLDGCEYNHALVQKLNSVFSEFDVTSAADMADGVVDVSEFSSILTRLYNEPPTAHDVQCLLERLSLDQSMTVNWDEFLYLMYNRQLAKGDHATGIVHTPLPHPIALPHY